MNYKVIQTMQYPPGDEKNYELYYRGTGETGLCREKRGIRIPRGEQLDFFTYFNGFYQKRWMETTGLSRFRVRVRGEGDFQIAFCHAGERDGKISVSEDESFHWQGREERTFAIRRWEQQEHEVCFLKVRGLKGDSVLEEFVIEAAAEEERPVRPGVVICTYKREEDVRKTLAAVEEMEENLRPAIFLIDNGNTLGEECFPDFVRYVPNKNCGGTGGFTRGILEVLESGEDFTHIVLMDDDIVLDPGVLEKTVRYLSFLKPPYSGRVLAGSLLYRDIPWMQYESGALWNRGRILACRHDLDLRERASLLKNVRKQKADYGGWWYCCFPVELIREKGLPLPLFLHRDDIEFGLRSGGILTMNGIGVWHEAFEEKLPQAGEYYDIRNMAIVNAMYAENWTKSEWKWFLRKWTAGNILRGRYEYIRLNMYGALDFLKGARWLEKTDAVLLHRRICGYLSPLKNAEEFSPEERKTYFCTTPGVSVYTAAVKKKIIYQDASGKCLTAEKSLGKALRCLWILHKTEKKTDRYFDRAKQSYQTKSRRMTAASFWKEYLEMEKK